MWLVAVVGRCLVGASTVKVTVRLAGSCRRVGGVDGGYITMRRH